MARTKTNSNGTYAVDVPAAVVLECYGRTDSDGMIYRRMEALEVDRHAAQRQIALDGGTAAFPGLYLGDVRLPARLVQLDGCDYWLIRPDAIRPEWRTDTAFPDMARGVLLRRHAKAGHLGLCERTERAPAHAVIAGRMVGPSIHEDYIAIRRTDGETWGVECEPVRTLEQVAAVLAAGVQEVTL